MDVISSMEEMNWTLETYGTSIRLVITDHSFGENRRYTILSETLSQKDWNFNYTMNTNDIALNHWANNQPANISLLEAHLDDEIPSNFSQFLKFINNLGSKNSRQSWNMMKFRSRLISVMINPKEAMDVLTQPIEQELPLGTDAMLEIQQVMENISLSFTELDFTVSNLNWADEVIENESLTDMSYELTAEIENSINALSSDLSNIYENPDRDDYNERNWMKMAASNRFFNNFDKLSEIQTGMRFYDFYLLAKQNETISAKGLLGKILSLCLLRHVYDGKDTFESLADLASESSRQVDTILSEKDLINLDLEDLGQTIKQLENTVNLLSGTAKVEIQKTLAKYKRLRLLKMSPIATGDSEEIDYGHFMSRIVNHIFVNKKTKFSNHNVEDNLKLSLIKVEMVEYLEKMLKDNSISNHEFTLKRENINRNVVSSYLIEVLEQVYSFKIDLLLYNQTHNIDDIHFNFI